MKKVLAVAVIAIASTSAIAANMDRIDIDKVSVLKFEHQPKLRVHGKDEVSTRSNIDFTANKQADGLWKAVSTHEGKPMFSGELKLAEDSDGVLKFKGTGTRYGEKVSYLKAYYPTGSRYHYVTYVCADKDCKLFSGLARLAEAK